MSTRCFTCRKKVSLAGTFSCVCEKVFCSAHRFADQHNCSCIEKIKEKDIQELKQKLVEVVASKIEKI